jgi:hypothetical protein
MDLWQKIFIIWQKAEIIPKLLDVAPLVGPLPMKIRVHTALGGPFTKKHLF